jgi:AAA15 family ATPase/GTPase
MIKKIHIQNFKSIYDLELDVGRVNLFIGENGSGKSNLLEALVFVSAGESNKLDNEFLFSRGLRVPEPELMRSAFDDYYEDENIEISIVFKNNLKKEYSFFNRNMPYSMWEEDNYHWMSQEVLNPKLSEKIKKEYQLCLDTKLNNFLIYSPEYEVLRNFDNEGQIQPLGVKGEGLYKLLKVVNSYEDKSYIKTIIESLQLFNWFDDITIPDELAFGEKKLIIKDKYLYTEIDQRSTNEGFLFILFYITLLVAKETPKAFAIDNVDSFLNPKLCTKLMILITDLAKKYDKQVFLTTHNPAILDGIDLNDEEQKLFVVSRNKKGHTRMKEITAKDKPKSSNDEPLKLSEAFLRGYLGGLPKGF